MKTGKYRVRRGLFGRAILQAQYNTPTYASGHIDSSIRDIFWKDVPFKYAPAELREALKPQEGKTNE